MPVGCAASGYAPFIYNYQSIRARPIIVPSNNSIVSLSLVIMLPSWLASSIPVIRAAASGMAKGYLIPRPKMLNRVLASHSAMGCCLIPRPCPRPSFSLYPFWWIKVYGWLSCFQVGRNQRSLGCVLSSCFLLRISQSRVFFGRL